MGARAAPPPAPGAPSRRVPGDGLLPRVRVPGLLDPVQLVQPRAVRVLLVQALLAPALPARVPLAPVPLDRALLALVPLAPVAPARPGVRRALLGPAGAHRRAQASRDLAPGLSVPRDRASLVSGARGSDA